MTEEFKYVDHLKDFVEEEITSIVDRREVLPGEFDGIEKDILIQELTNEAQGILRNMASVAIWAGVERYASLIRYSRKSK